MKQFEVIWTNSAQFDLESIIEYIKIDSLSIAKKIFFEIKEECNSLYTFPKRKRIVPELQQIGILKYREIIYKRWRIIYKVDDKKVYILLVVDSSRNLEDVLFQRLLKTK
ncbi:type II toxin-antitoxin system RelE/ParE family toxin [Poseidonibacter lekithochrous]|uniref:type II toxin-antitoxin system RelE/ParE family toxin n=1 Tax=Poseidonibacter TaxID=2321187 RepID=UPI001C086358|nr:MULTISPECIES: type II toxin-antitoxin system RelE/ParE family toxin [Poseidonibacter]MBU3015124.1 type II toxin-antitoxin system RelE/ParE family toxin [Poseidonibacter lekithochrous]MDO6828421.1 type II toxin-antitoxin system RelE/ParE family toxin [Poseidonibacter sp. 1_MG-2023]